MTMRPPGGRGTSVDQLLDRIAERAQARLEQTPSLPGTNLPRTDLPQFDLHASVQGMAEQLRSAASVLRDAVSPVASDVMGAMPRPGMPPEFGEAARLAQAAGRGIAANVADPTGLFGPMPSTAGMPPAAPGRAGAMAAALGPLEEAFRSLTTNVKAAGAGFVEFTKDFGESVKGFVQGLPGMGGGRGGMAPMDDWPAGTNLFPSAADATAERMRKLNEVLSLNFGAMEDVGTEVPRWLAETEKASQQARDIEQALLSPGATRARWTTEEERERILAEEQAAGAAVREERRRERERQQQEEEPWVLEEVEPPDEDDEDDDSTMYVWSRTENGKRIKMMTFDGAPPRSRYDYDDDDDDDGDDDGAPEAGPSAEERAQERILTLSRERGREEGRLAMFRRDTAYARLQDLRMQSDEVEKHGRRIQLRYSMERNQLQLLERDERQRAQQQQRQEREEYQASTRRYHRFQERERLSGQLAQTFRTLSLMTAGVSTAMGFLADRMGRLGTRLESVDATSRSTGVALQQMATGFEALTGIRIAAEELENFERAQRRVIGGLMFGERPSRNQVIAYSSLGIAIGEVVEWNDTLYERLARMPLAFRETVASILDVPPAIMSAIAMGYEWNDAIASGMVVTREQQRQLHEQGVAFRELKNELQEVAVTFAGPALSAIGAFKDAVLDIFGPVIALVDAYPKLAAGVGAFMLSLAVLMPVLMVAAQVTTAMMAAAQLGPVGIAIALGLLGATVGTALGGAAWVMSRVGDKQDEAVSNQMQRMARIGTEQGAKEGVAKGIAEVERDAKDQSTGRFSDWTPETRFMLGRYAEDPLLWPMTGTGEQSASLSNTPVGATGPGSGPIFDSSGRRHSRFEQAVIRQLAEPIPLDPRFGSIEAVREEHGDLISRYRSEMTPGNVNVESMTLNFMNDPNPAQTADDVLRRTMQERVENNRR